MLTVAVTPWLIDNGYVCVQVYDLNGDGSLTVSELTKFVTQDAGTRLQSSQFVEECLADLDTNADGVISKKEFVTALKKDRLLFDCFAASMVSGVSLHHIGPRVKELQKHSSRRFDLGMLRSLWERASKGGKLELNRTEFRNFMMSEFDCPPETSPLLNRLFAAFDADGSGSVGWRELFAGLAQVTSASIDDKSKFFFQLFAGKRRRMDRLQVSVVLYFLPPSFSLTHAHHSAIVAAPAAGELAVLNTEGDSRHGEPDCGGCRSPGQGQ